MEENKIISEEELNIYLQRFKQAFNQIIDITLNKLQEQFIQGRLNEEVIIKVMIGCIGNCQELALKMLGVDIQQEGQIAQIDGMRQSIKDNRLLKALESAFNGVGIAAQGGAAVPEVLWKMLFITQKNLLEKAGLEKEVESLDWDVKKYSGA